MLRKVVVIHRGRCNNKVYYRSSHDVVTLNVDRDVSIGVDKTWIGPDRIGSRTGLRIGSRKKKKKF